jgi:hypothetical protein
MSLYWMCLLNSLILIKRGRKCQRRLATKFWAAGATGDEVNSRVSTISQFLFFVMLLSYLAYVPRFVVFPQQGLSFSCWLPIQVFKLLKVVQL